MHSIASSDTYAPSAPQLPVSSEARPSIRRSRPGSRVRPAHGLSLIGVDYPADEDLAARNAQTR
ncbi:hypothetical protein ACWESP_30905, partial [Nocardia beijingensis]